MKVATVTYALALCLSVGAPWTARAQASIDWPCINKPAKPPHGERLTAAGDTLLTDQQSLNCFAWKQFLALTQRSERASKSGGAQDVFEDFAGIHALLPASGMPPPWETRPGSAKRRMFDNHKLPLKLLRSDVNEAFPTSGGAWLADVNGNLVWYEILVNRPEYDYFRRHGLYKASNQAKLIKNGGRIDLPRGDLNGKRGAIEIKAAWLAVPKGQRDQRKWSRFKRTKALNCAGASSASRCVPETLALVGMHIIHKSASQPTWIWTTFEHKDNAPDLADVRAAPGLIEKGRYTFFDPDCRRNGRACPVNTPPDCALEFKDGKPVGSCAPYPIQVARVFPISDSNENPVVDTNAAAHLFIDEIVEKGFEYNPVYKNYNLVNVLWNDATVDENRAATAPVGGLSQTGFRPTPVELPMANTVLETYAQSMTCISCHASATIAGDDDEASGPKPASDYSFIFGLARQ